MATAEARIFFCSHGGRPLLLCACALSVALPAAQCLAEPTCLSSGPAPVPCRMAPEHEAAVAREIRRLEASQGLPLRGFWEDSPAAAEGAGASQRGGGAIVIK